MTLQSAGFCFSFSVVALSGMLVCQGCGPSQPIITNRMEPWEEEIVREKVAEREEEERRNHQRLARQTEEGFGTKKPPDEHNVIVTTFVDIVAFPVRGAAWLAHTIF